MYLNRTKHNLKIWNNIRLKMTQLKINPVNGLKKIKNNLIYLIILNKQTSKRI